MSAILTKSNQVINSNSYEYISATPVTNKDFLKTLKTISRGHGNLLVASFPQPPSQGYWGSRILTRADEKELENGSDKNWYAVVSTFASNRRRKTDFKAMVAIMVDDPGTKVPFENIVLPPTYWLETSPGNYQAWYFLAEPITDRAYAESIVNAMVAQGLSKDGKDPGMKGVTRYGRLPGGWNNKESLETPHRVTAYEDTRGCNYYTAEQIVEAYELDLAAVAHLSNGDIQGDVDQLDVLTAQSDPIYKMFDSLGLIKYIQGHKIEITCPWVDDHTGGVDNGAALLILSGGGLGFKCHHGHDEHKTLDDVHRWLRENHYELYESYYPQKNRKEPKREDEPTLEDAINALLDREPSQTEIALTVPDLADEYATGTYDIRRIIQTIQKDRDAIEASETVDIDALAKAAGAQLSLDKAFPKPLANAIATKCDSDRLDPIRPMQSLLPTLAAQLGARTCIVLKPATNPKEEWREYCQISCMDVGYSSENKSQTNRTVAAPLIDQQNQLKQEYKNARDLYNEACRIARRQNAEMPQEPPEPITLFVEKGTSEGIMKRVSELPDRGGMVYYCDEAAGLIAGADQYKQRSNFRNTLLTALSSPISGVEERSSKEAKIIFNHQTLCISGSIQPGRIKYLFDANNDDSGLGSRFLWAYPDLPDNFDSWSETKVNVFGELKGLIEYLQDVGDPEDEPIRCFMNKSVKRQFIKHYEAYRRIQKNNRDSNPGLAAFIGKCAGHLGRLILLSHWIACYYGEEKPGKITLTSFNRATHQMGYYIGQFRLLQIKVSDSNENYGKLHLYILEQLKRKSEVADRGIRKGFNEAKKWQGTVTVYEVRQAFKDLAANDVGALVNDGRGLKKA